MELLEKLAGRLSRLQLTHWLTGRYWLGWSCWLKLSVHKAALALKLWSLNTQ